MRRLRSIRIESVKDFVQIGVGLTAIMGGLITAATVFLGGNGNSNSGAAQANLPATVTPVVAVASTPVATSFPTDTPAPTSPPPTEVPPSPTPPPTATPAPSGEFLRAQFGTQQDLATLLPAGVTASPGEVINVCPGDTLFAWVYHNFGPGDIIDGRLSDRAGVLFSASVPVEAGASSFWISALVATTGSHTLSVALHGSDIRAEWSVEVSC